MVAWIRTRAKPCRSLNLTAPTRCKLRFHPLRFHGESPLFPHHSVSYSTSLFLSVPFLLHFLLFPSRLYFPSSFPPFLVLPFSFYLRLSFLCPSFFVSRISCFANENLFRYISRSFRTFFSLSFSPLFFLNFFPSHPFSCFFFLLLLSFKFSFSFTSFQSFSVFYLFSFFLFSLRLSFLYFISSFIFLREFHSNRVDTSHVYNPYLVMFAGEKNHGKSSSCSASPRFVLFFFFLVHSSVILYLFETFDRDIL